MTDNIFTAWLPLRRIIVLLFVVAALVGGIVGVNAGDASEPQFRVVERSGAAVVVADSDGDTWNCHYDGNDMADFVPNADDCSRPASLPGGPVEQLGYPSEELAGRECKTGEVIPLYRQGNVMGYSCLIGGRQ